MDNKKMHEDAVKVYEKMINTLDAMEWKYQRNDERLTVKYIVTGEDLPMEFYVTVDEGFQAVRHVSVLPVKFPEEKRLDGVLAACSASCGLPEGYFSCNVKDGRITFVSASNFRECRVSNEWFASMMQFAHGIVDKYNDRFLMLAKGMTDISGFVNQT